MKWWWSVLFLGVAFAQDAPLTMTYQGHLTDDAGEAVDGTRAVTFRLYAQSDAGDPLWIEVHPEVDVEAGALTAVLGSVTAFPEVLDPATPLYLGVQVEDDGELTPRMRVGGALRTRWAALAAQAVDVRDRDIHPRTVSIGDRPVIDADARWVGDPTGLVGPAGAPGERGADGELGPQGEPGAPGEAGAPGPQGDVGPPGPAGVDGERGPQGEVGPRGPAGENGAPGLQGEVGPRGPAGENGARGLQGEVGPRGPAGENGARGPAGSDGARGPQGEVGARGPAGGDGARGPAGPAGADGVALVWRGSGAAAPGDPGLNHAYYDTTARRSYIWDGDSWETLVRDGAQGPPGGAAGGRAGPSFAFPDGTENMVPVFSSADQYVVPEGMNLYVTSVWQERGFLMVDGCEVLYGRNNYQSGDFPSMYMGLPLILGAGQTINFTDDGSFNGFLVPATVTPVVWCEGTDDYVVPPDLLFTITNLWQERGFLELDREHMLYGRAAYGSGQWHGINLNQPIFVGPGQVLNFTQAGTLLGYLKPL